MQQAYPSCGLREAIWLVQ